MNIQKHSNSFRLRAVICLLALLACVPGRGHAQTIPNPGFEADAFTNWPGYVNGNFPITGWTAAPADRVGLNPVAPEGPFSDNGTVPQGTNVALIQSDGDVPSTLATVITGLTRGWEYHVSFRANSRQLYGGAPAPSWSLNGGAFVPFVGSPPVGGTNPYYFVTGFFTATTDTAELVIRNQTLHDSTVLVDDFSIVVGAMIPNPSFEAESFTNFPGYAVDNGGGITGWTISEPARIGLNPAAGNPFADNGATPHGTNVAFLQSFGGSQAYISTTLSNLVPNQTYEVRFRANMRGASDAPEAYWSLNGGPLKPIHAAPAVGGSNDYRTNIAIFVATGTTAALQVYNNPLFVWTFDSALLVDDFSVRSIFLPLVVTTSDGGLGSLRDIIAQSPSGTTITFDAGLNGQTIVLTNGELSLTNNLIIDGSSLPDGIRIDGRAASRIFNVASGTTNELRFLTLTNGYTSGGNHGGAVSVSGSLTMNSCTLVGNSSETGGAIYGDFGSALTLWQCTLTTNSAINGGAIGSHGALTVVQCTIAGNAAGNGGGIYNLGALALTNSIVAANTPNNLAGNAAIGSYNFTNGEPMLALFGRYGGPTPTMPPRYDSPVVNGCLGGTSFAIDQRGIARIVGAYADIGAAESVVINFRPANGATVFTSRPTLSWTGPATADHYEPYFGTSPGNLILLGYSSPSAPYALPDSPLANGSNYFWRVDTIVGGVRFTGPELSFTARPISTTNDTGPGSLRQVIADAPADSTIGFAPELSGQTLFLTNGPLVLTKNLTLDASMLPAGLALDGRNAGRVIETPAGTTNWLIAMTISGGAAAGHGGGLQASGEVGLYRCTLLRNTASGGGGALAVTGTNARLFLISCTIASNSAVWAGGVFSRDAALEIWQSTVARNTGNGSGGLVLEGGTAQIANNIIALNNGATDPDIGGGGTALTLVGGNLIGDNSGAYAPLMPAGLPNTNGHFVGTFAAPLDPLLTPLGAYGGPTPTVLLQHGSPAVNAGANVGLSIDQRGAPLLYVPDLGATEMIVDYPTPANRGSTLSLNPQLSWSEWSPGASSFRVSLGTNSANLTSFAEQQEYWFDMPEALVPGQTYLWRVDVRVNGTFFTGPEFSFTCRAFANTNDSGPGSLRDAIAAAPPGTTLKVPANLAGQAITLASELVLDKNLTLQTSLAGGFTLRGGGADRVLRVTATSTSVLDGLTLTNGFAAEHGGGLLTEGVLTVRRCTLVGNSAGGGGGGAAVLGAGWLFLDNCTVTSNRASFGGGLYSQDASLGLRHVTLAGNTGLAGAGGVVLSNGFGAFTNSVLAHNSGGPEADVTGADATLVISGTNFIGRNNGGYLADLTAGQPNAAGQYVGTGAAPLDAQLAPFGDYGGPTPTLPPLWFSRLVDRASLTGSSVDQRRLLRVAGPRADIGAVELEPNTVVSTNLDTLTYGTLRYALNYANPSTSNLITFATNLSGATILLTNGQLLLNKDLTIDASALPGGISLNGNRTNRIFEISSSRTVQLSALTITNGSAPAGSFPANSGGGILNRGILTLNDCTLVNNQARLGTQPRGGGIANSGGILILNRSTLTGNLASHRGGGLYNSGRADLNQCTLAVNLATNAAGAISSETIGTGYLSLNHSTIVSNVTVNGGRTADGSGTMTFSNSIVVWSGAPSLTGYTLLGVNLVGDTNAQLAPLGYYGGRTQTMPPLPGSSAIDAATSGSGFTTDQRGAARIVGAFPDIGSVEANWLAPVISDVSTTILSTDPATSLRTVLLSARIIPNGTLGTPTSTRFDYGTTPAFGAIFGPVFLPVSSTPSLISVQVQLGDNQGYHWRVTATNSLGVAIEDRTFTLGTVPTNAPAGLPGDINGDGIVSQAELDAVYGHYLTNSPWLQMTNLAGLGTSNVSFALPNPATGGYTVEVTSDLVNWLPLGPATPRYQFTDTNAPAGPTRYYRLRHP